MVDIGIMGLAKSGRTTVFNALTGGKAGTGGMASHVGIARVPDPRLRTMADMVHPKKVVPAEVRYHDIGASTKGLVKAPGISGQLLNDLSSLSAIISVVRYFADESVLHIEGCLDIERDIAAVNLEIAFSDLALLERRLERIALSLKGAKPPERQSLLHEQEMLAKLKADLEDDVPIRELELTAGETKAITGYQFLSAKPLLIVVNIGEAQLPQAVSMEAELNSCYSRPGCHIIVLCGKLDMELAQLDEDAADGFRADFGIKESGLDRAIKQSYDLLGLISFFTMGPSEVRAWSIRKGTSALQAAGKIHSDIERGFIRAEVVSYDDLVKCGGIAESRKGGRLRLEGKDYIVQDGDIVNILFNV